MSLRCSYLLSMCLLLLQLAICTSLPRHNLTTKVPLRLHNNRSGRNRGGIALAITRELALHRAWDSSALARAKQRNASTTNHIVDEVIEYYGQQHDKILRELLLPSLSNVKGENEAVSKPSEGAWLGWDIAMSTQAAPLQCAVLATVPPGTVMVRPKLNNDEGGSCHYISVPALNSLVRLQPGCIKMLFPNAQEPQVEHLYAHASLMTCFMSTVSSSAEIRRLLSLLIVTTFTTASHRLLLAVFFSALRLQALWNPQVYALWSRIYHTPMPMLLITAKKGVEMLFHSLSCLDDYIRDWSLSMEGHMLNSDIYRHAFQPRVVTDYKGRQRRYETVFNTPKT